MIWSLKQTPGSPICKFLIGKGVFEKENLEKLQDVDLAAELEHASPVQKSLIYSAIKFYLNYFYESTQSEKFEELNIKGVEYDEIENAPDVRLAVSSSTNCNIFQSSFFDFVLFNFIVFNGDDKNAWLNESIDFEKQNGYYTSTEKTFLSVIVSLEPNLLTDEAVGIKISDEVKNKAEKNILRNKPEYLSSLLSKEFNQKEIKEPLKLLTILNDMVEKLSNSAKEKVNDYKVVNSDDSLAKLKNTIFNELGTEDKIQFCKYIDTNYHEDEVLPLGDL